MSIALFGGQGAMVCRFEGLYIWAERGLLHIEDSHTNFYGSVSVRDGLLRMTAISDMLKNSRQEMKTSGFMHAEEYEKNMVMLEQMTDLCRRAQEQGMPFDKSMMAANKRARPLTIVMPGAGSAM